MSLVKRGPRLFISLEPTVFGSGRVWNERDWHYWYSNKIVNLVRCVFVFRLAVFQSHVSRLIPRILIFKLPFIPRSSSKTFYSCIPKRWFSDSKWWVIRCEAACMKNIVEIKRNKWSKRERIYEEIYKLFSINFYEKSY